MILYCFCAKQNLGEILNYENKWLELLDVMIYFSNFGIEKLFSEDELLNID